MSMLRCCTAVLVLILCSGALVAQGYTASTITNSFATHNISATGTILPGGANLDDDGELVPFPTGFTFPFYGAVYDHVRVESNGWVYFGPDQNLTQVQRRDAPLVTPNSVLPNNWIAGCWDDLDPTDPLSGKVKVERLSSPDRFVIHWDGIPHWAQAATQMANFVIVLFATGTIEVHYNTPQTIPGPMGVGIENAGGTVAVPRPGGFATVPTATDAFRWDPPANSPPAILVERNVGTTPVPVLAASNQLALINSTVAQLDLRFSVTDLNADTLTLTTTVTPSANITGFVNTEWNAGPSATQPVTAQPLSGSFPTIGLINVVLSASDGVNAAVTYAFTIEVIPIPMPAGTYTVAAGNPGSAFDYADIGAFFDELEDRGVAGPVVLEVYDDGGPFTSVASYQLGGDATVIDEVRFVDATNTITIRAAAGESPVINGSGASNPFSSAALSGISLTQMSYVTIEGLTLAGALNAGIMAYTTVTQTDVRIARCRIHSVSAGAGIFFYGNAPATNNVTIENNMIWNCSGNAGSNWFSSCLGVIGARRPGTGWIIRHNTIVHNAAAAGTSVFFQNGNANPFDRIEYNVVYLSDPTAIPVLLQDLASAAPLPNAADRNVIFIGGGAVMSNNPAVATWGAWQTAGYDANGLNVDPLLVSVAGAGADLHLQNVSPAIDLAVGSNAAIDIDGQARPIGAAPDAGAHEAFPLCDIEVHLGTVNINDGGTVSAGAVSAATGAPLTFSISNLGPGDLFLTGTPIVELVPGANCGPGTVVQLQPAATVIPATASADFVVFIEPVMSGAFDFTISIDNTDPNENPFNFTVMGNANAAAEVALPGTSAFTLQAPGVYALAVDPATALANAVLELTDPESDDIEILNVSVSPGALAGVAAPVVAAPASSPVMLTWTGTVDGSNDPGDYTWDITFRDTVNLTQGMVTAIITLNDLPPQHAPADALSGNGTVAAPYYVEYTQGDSGAIAIDLADLSDPNTSQLLALGAITPGAGTPTGGTGFQFTNSGGALRVAPAGTLVLGDFGMHAYTVEVTDGTNTINIEVSILVFGTTGAITFSTSSPLPAGTINKAYNRPIAVAGATGAVSFSLASGALPLGLTVSPTGVISGTPTEVGNSTFELRVVDSTNDTAVMQYQLRINERPSASPDDGGSCTTQGSSAWWLPALISSLAVVALRRRRTQA